MSSLSRTYLRSDSRWRRWISSRPLIILLANALVISLGFVVRRGFLRLFVESKQSVNGSNYNADCQKYFIEKKSWRSTRQNRRLSTNI